MRRPLPLILVIALLAGTGVAREGPGPLQLNLAAVTLSSEVLSADEEVWNYLVELPHEGSVILPGGPLSARIEKKTAVLSWALGRHEHRVALSPRGAMVNAKEMGPKKKDMGLLVLAHPRFGTPFVVNAWALRTRIDKEILLLVDADLDGRFGELGEDLLILTGPQRTWVLPVMESLPIGDHLGAITVSGDKKTLTITPRKTSADREHREAIAVLNALRLRIGVPACRLDDAMTAGAARAEGAVVRKSDEHAAFAVRLNLATFYRRLATLDPGQRRVGIAHAGGKNVLATASGREGIAIEDPIVVPAPGQYNVPLGFAPDHPDPHPDGRRDAGYPVTVVPAAGVKSLTGVKAEVAKADGERIDCFPAWPGRPANDLHPENLGAILVLPMRPLAPFTEYRVKVRYTYLEVQMTLRWVFFTGGTEYGAKAAKYLR